VSSNNSSKNIAAIVIAAGESRRFKGQIKQLIDWLGKPLIAHILSIILEIQFSPIHVVLGAHFDQINPIVRNLPVKVIHNKDWRKGKGTSISLGIQLLPENILAAMVFVVDQPFLSTQIIRKIQSEFSKNKNAEIIAPYYQGIQGNPVLFSKKVFPDLIKLREEKGGKEIMKRYKAKKVPWTDEKILLDIDTVEDYEAALSLSNLPD
jgi:molybdenum cofactor cytidylyltransferase